MALCTNLIWSREKQVSYCNFLSQDIDINELNQDLVHTNFKNAQIIAAILLVEI